MMRMKKGEPLLTFVTLLYCASFSMQLTDPVLRLNHLPSVTSIKLQQRYKYWQDFSGPNSLVILFGLVLSLGRPCICIILLI